MNEQSKKDIKTIVGAFLVGACVFGTAYVRSNLVATILYSVFTVYCTAAYSYRDWEDS